MQPCTRRACTAAHAARESARRGPSACVADPCRPLPVSSLLLPRDQCEDRSRVRPCLPTPARGALPLPPGADAAALAYLPQRVEDLKAVIPAGHPQLASPQKDARVGARRAVEGPHVGQSSDLQPSGAASLSLHARIPPRPSCHDPSNRVCWTSKAARAWRKRGSSECREQPRLQWGGQRISGQGRRRGRCACNTSCLPLSARKHAHGLVLVAEFSLLACTSLQVLHIRFEPDRHLL